MRIIITILITTVAVFAMQNFRAVSVDQATLLKTDKNKKYCTVCGMTLPLFYKTNHAAKHQEHHEQYCSIVCAIEDQEVNGKQLTDFKTVDNTTLKFINSKNAYFVVGSSKPGTMSVVSKYAFGTKEAAQNFSDANGGEVMRFDALYKYVKKSQAKDMAATKKRQAKAIKKGKMMYKKMCKQTDKSFSTIAGAKTFLSDSKICGNIKGKKLQAIGMYLVRRDK